jgi:hypothetical protein
MLATQMLYYLSLASSPFAFSLFVGQSGLLALPSLALDHNPPISVSLIAGIIGLHHNFLATEPFTYFHIVVLKEKR